MRRRIAFIALLAVCLQAFAAHGVWPAAVDDVPAEVPADQRLDPPCHETAAAANDRAGPEAPGDDGKASHCAKVCVLGVCCAGSPAAASAQLLPSDAASPPVPGVVQPTVAIAGAPYRPPIHALS